MTLVLLVLQIILAVCLIIVVLLQRTGEEGWSGLTSSASGTGLMSKKSSANFFTRTTSIIAALFMINSLVLANLVPKENKSNLVTQEATPSDVQKKEEKPTTSIPLAE